MESDGMGVMFHPEQDSLRQEKARLSEAEQEPPLASEIQSQVLVCLALITVQGLNQPVVKIYGNLEA